MKHLKRNSLTLLKLTVLSLLFVLTLASCMKKKELTQTEAMKAETIQKQLMEMENYGTTAVLKRYSNKGENVYDTRQFYKSTGEYRLEILAPEQVAGSVTVFDGKMVSQYNPRIQGKVAVDVPESKARDEMFLGNFIKNYLQSQEVTLEVSSFDGAECTILEAIIPGDHPYLSTEKLWVNNETLKPEKLIIYGQDGKEKIEVIFQDFEFNMELPDDIFKVVIVE